MDKLIEQIIAFLESRAELYTDELLLAFKGLPREIIDVFIADADIVGGVIQYTDNTLIALMQVNKMLSNITKGKPFTDALNRYIDDFSKLDALNKMLQRKANDVTVDILKLLGKERSRLLDVLKFNLTETAYKHDILVPLMQEVTNTTLLGGGLKEMEQALADKLTPDRLRYTTTSARDGLHGYYGTQNAAIAQEFGMTGYAYVGSIRETSRPFCRHVIKDLKGTIKIEALPALLRQYQDSDGMMPDTTSVNFPIKRGGYGCLHQAIPIFI